MAGWFRGAAAKVGPWAGGRLHLRASVRVRTTLAAVLVTTVAVAVAGWFLLRSLEDKQLREVRGEMHDQLDQVAARLEAGDEPQQAVNGPPVAQYVQVCDEQGHVLGSPAGRRTSQVGPAGAPAPDCSGLPDGAAEQAAVGSVAHGDEQVMGEAETITREVTTESGTFEVAATAPTGQVEQVRRSVDALRGALAVGLPLLVIAVAAVAWVVVGRALRPVDAIRAEVDAITGSTMHRRVPEPPTGDEIGRLARTMNAMLSRLDATATRQRQFVSDASHELRSPVAAIRTSLEVARRKGDAANWPAVADTALAEESRLESLLDDLLLLAAQDENGTTGFEGTPVDLVATALAEAERPRRRAVRVRVAHRSNASSSGAPPLPLPLVVQGDADQLARAMSNLLDNAARHATSTVQVDLDRDAGTVRLTVDDDGPGIPPADRERVFERFTRLDDGRSRDDGGTGLGLAVVRTIVARHHGVVRVGDSPLGGARLTVELPAALLRPDPRQADPRQAEVAPAGER